MSARLKESITSYGNDTGTRLTLTSILLMPEAIFRMEMGLGEKLTDGRRKLSQAEIAYALGYALMDLGPDKEIMNDLPARNSETPPRSEPTSNASTTAPSLGLRKEGQGRTRAPLLPRVLRLSGSHRCIQGWHSASWPHASP